MHIKQAVAAIVAALAAAFVLTGCTPEDGAGTGSAGTAPSGPASTTATDSRDTGSDDTAGATPTVTDGPDTGSLGQSGGDGSEVLPSPSATPTSLAELIEDRPGAALMTSAPAGGSGQGIVETFPSDVILVPESSHVRSTSVSSDNGLVQVTLDAAVPTTCAETLVDYRGWFGRGGFVETSTSESADRAQVSFTRGGDVVTLTTLAGADACDVAVVAVLEVAG